MKCLDVHSEGFPWGYYMSCYLSRTTGAVSNNLHVVQNLTVRNNTLINKTQITFFSIFQQKRFSMTYILYAYETYTHTQR